MATDVSICIPNYNGAEILKECLDAALQQKTDCEVEILVYDDASTDSSLALLRETYPFLTVLEGEENVGFSRACNRLAAAAQGRYLLLLNNDAFLEPGALQALWSSATESPQSLLTLRQVDAQSGALLDLGMGLDMLTVPYPLREAPSTALATLIGACLWVPAALFADVGGFPPWFESVAEDLYLCQYARLRGHTLKVIDTHCYRHHSGWTFGGGKANQPGESTSYRRRFLSERNRAFVFLIFYPWHYLLPLLPLWLASWLLESLVLCVAQRSLGPATRIYGQALTGVIRALGQIAQARKHVRNDRAISYAEFFTPYSWQPAKLNFLLRHGPPRLRWRGRSGHGNTVTTLALGPIQRSVSCIDDTRRVYFFRRAHRCHALTYRNAVCHVGALVRDVFLPHEALQPFCRTHCIRELRVG